MSIAVTGATGHLGALAIQALLDRGAEPGDIVATGRNRDRLAGFEARGIRTAPIDFDDVESLRTAFKDARQLLLVSSSQVGRRVTQHQSAIDAARDAGVGLIAYTSAPHADTTSLGLAAEHLATEKALRASGVPFVLLRNGWYLENYTEQIPQYLQQGRIIGAAGDGRISGAARADFAEAAATVITTPGHEGAVYELGGDEAFTMPDLADELSRQTGETVPYENLSVETYTQVLIGAGVPEPFASILADNDRAVAAGELHIDTGDLHRLIGHPPTTLRQAITDALA